MYYRVDAIFRGRNGKELLRRTPIWTGESDDAKGAIVQAHEPVTVVCKTAPRHDEIDSISLTVRGEDGSMINTTEYAEDFTIAYGASAYGASGLALDGVAPELTEAQQEAAQKLLKARAVAALPDSAQERLRQRAMEDRDPLRDFFGGELPSERAAGEAVNAPVDDPFRSGSAPTPSDLVSPGPGCDKTFNDCKNKWNNEENFGGGITAEQARASSPVFVEGMSEDIKISAPTMEEIERVKRGYRLLISVNDRMHRIQQISGRRASGVVVNQRDARDMAKALGLPNGSIDGGMYKGLKVTVDNNCVCPQVTPGFTQGGYANYLPDYIVDRTPE